MKNILITGGAGYIGSHVIEKLIKRKKKVFIVDNLVTGYKKLINKKAKFYKLNILNPFLMTIPLQLLAYHVESLKNYDIDKPRNLAKSVTVE